MLLTGTYGARSADDLLEVLASPQAALCDLIELRLDLPADANARVEELIARSPRPVLATCRAQPGLSADERRSRLFRAVRAGASWVDLEDDAGADDVARFSDLGAKILRSAHVRSLPTDADALVARLLEPPATLAKLVALSGTADDAVRLLALVEKWKGRLAAHIVPIPFTRPASAALGAPIVYAAIRAGTGLNLRLPTARYLVEEAGVRHLAAGAQPFLLLGNAVEGSVSPQMLNAAFRAASMDIVSLRFSCDNPEPALRAIAAFGWRGAAVTTPHKERALAVLREMGGTVAPSAERVGALNTVIRAGETLVAHNTDLSAIVDILAEAFPPSELAGQRALVLGAGGAARAAVVALRDLGADPVVVARTASRAATFGTQAVTLDAAEALDPAVVVNATPIGTRGEASPVDFRRFARASLALEMVVASEPTAFERSALAAGRRSSAGLSMLVAQAMRQVALMGEEGSDGDLMARVAAAALMRRDRPLVLVGLRCVGKSSVGPLLAELLGRPFLDTDTLVHAMTGRTPSEMIRSGDERAFRQAEATVLSEANFTGAVVATGGGFALQSGALRASLAARSTVIALDAADDVLLARWASSPRAPLTDLAPREELARQRAERMESYFEHAALRVDTSFAEPYLVAERVADWFDGLNLASVGVDSGSRPLSPP